MGTDTGSSSRLSLATLRTLPGFAGVGILAWWVLKDGGYAETVWLPGLLAFLALGAATALARMPSEGKLPRLSIAAIGLLGGYVAWSALSILWAEYPGLALTGTLRACLFLAVLVLFAALPWQPISAARLLTGLVLAVAAVGVVAMARLAAAPTQELADLLLQSRLAWPLAYQNANAALWTMAAVPALVLASRRETFWALRPVLLAAAVLLLDLGLLSQSRGWLFTLPLIALATAVLVPNRLRLAPWALALGCSAAVAADPMLAIYRAGGEEMPASRLDALAQSIESATGWLLLACVLALAAGALLTFADDRWDPRPETQRRLGIAVAAVIAIALGGGVAAAFVATDGDPADRVSNAWEDFKENRAEGEGQGRFAAFGSSRYDFWRVALNEFREHPLGGIGQDNFAEAYLEHRRNLTEEPRWAHSVELRLLVHTGLGGALLFFGFVGCLVAAAVRSRVRPGWLPATLLLPVVVWLLHGSVDWLWEYPALSGFALAPAGIALALTRQLRPAATPPRRAWLGRAGTTAAVVLGLAAAVVGAATFLSERLTDRAEVQWVSDPNRAFDDLDRASSLQPLSSHPDLVAGLIAMRRGEYDRAEDLLKRAEDRAPGSWFIRFCHGFAASAARDVAGAREAFERARELNPQERLVAQALRRLATRRPMTFDEAARELRSRVQERFGD